MGEIMRNTPGFDGAAGESLEPGRLVRFLPVPLLLLLLAGRTPAIAGATTGLAGQILSGA
jgi:hypothetical protein